MVEVIAIGNENFNNNDKKQRMAFELEGTIELIYDTQQMDNFYSQQGGGGHNFNPSPETIDDLPF